MLSNVTSNPDGCSVNCTCLKLLILFKAFAKYLMGITGEELKTLISLNEISNLGLSLLRTFITK